MAWRAARARQQGSERSYDDGRACSRFEPVRHFRAAEGRLSLSDTLGRFFPDAPADKRGITVRQLLNHRAGFPQHIGPDSEVIALAPYLARAFAQPLAFTPGSGEQYSNTGYSILAAIIQQITGRSFDEVVTARVFQPAGMSESGYLLPRFDPRRLARGYSGGQDLGTMLDKRPAEEWTNVVDFIPL